jgi:hypothetical protein
MNLPAHGYEVLRTPVRHCELIPIELIWVQVKGFVAKNNTTFRIKDVKELTYAAFGKITKDVWTNFRIIDGHIELPYCRLFFDKSNKRSIKLETAVT